ncbi:MAG: cation:proton antiporter [Bryobacterales bacterium]|nr:cation:proton antiporter [Bryobacterales bacterium]
MHATRSFAPQAGEDGAGAAGTAVAFGYLLLSALFAGSIFKSFGLPRLTGYLVTGILAGPQVMGLVSLPALDNLEIFNGMAIALIALTAGAELGVREMKPLLRSIFWIIVVAILGVMAILSATIYLCRDLLPFFNDLTLIQAVGVATVLGVTMTAQSPAVVIALRSEMQAEGPVSRTVLGVVVLSDLVVILIFAVVSSLTTTLFGNSADALETAGRLAWEILGSVGAGVLAGLLLAGFFKHVKGGAALFVLAVAFVMAEVGQRVDFDPLIIACAAGALVRNFTAYGHQLLEEIEGSSLAVYVVFFAVTGASIHIDALQLVGIPAAIFVLVRGTGFYGLNWVAGTIARAPMAIRKYAGFGLMPQAGLALALALLFSRTFPDLGATASALVLGGVAINEMVAPILYRFALVKSGEAGAANATPSPELEGEPALATGSGG